MTITNLFLFVPFILAQLAFGIFTIKWGFDIGVPFPIAFAGLIFIGNAICGIASSLQD